MESKLKSRKFWMVVATFVAGIVAVFTETEVDPEIIFGYMGVLAAWLGIQGWADKAQAASGITMERRLYAAQMSAAMEQLAAYGAVGAVEPGAVPSDYPPLEIVD